VCVDMNNVCYCFKQQISITHSQYCEYIQIENDDRQVNGLTKVAHRRSGDDGNLNELVDKNFI